MTQVDVTNGTITITYGNEANAKISGADAASLTPYETPDASVAWKCGAANAPAGAVPARHAGCWRHGRAVGTTDVAAEVPAEGLPSVIRITDQA